MINILEYSKCFNVWPSLVNYIYAKNAKYNLSLTKDYEIDSKIVLAYLQSQGKKCFNFNEKLYNSFDRFLRDCKNLKKSSIESQNIYRLLFCLGITTTTEAQNFCINYAHVNELSARHYNDFIVLCGINLHLTYKDIYPYLIDSKALRRFPTSPSRLQYGLTQKIYTDVIHNQIQSLDDMVRYISNEENLDQFALTRNTAYLWLFEIADWRCLDQKDWQSFFLCYPEFTPDNYSSFTEDDWNDFIDLINEEGVSSELHNALTTFFFNERPELNVVIRKDHSDTCAKIIETYHQECNIIKSEKDITLHDYYLNTFGLSWHDSNDHLTEKEIETLAKLFPTAFLSYDTYKELFYRTRNADITSGTMLICTLLYVSFEKDDPDSPDEYFIDYTSHDAFVSSFNTRLDLVGCAELNPLAPFDRLFIETFDETLAAHPDCSSSDMKNHFIVNLRNNLRLFIPKENFAQPEN